MNPLHLLLYSAVLLIGPRLLMPRPRTKPEIRGYRRLLWGINRLYCRLWHGLDSPVSAPLPVHGPAILIANHTCGVDPPLLQATSDRVLGFLIAREFYEHRVFHPLCRILGCIPVRRDGRDLAATRAALRALKEGRVVPIFPEGRINPTSGRTLLEPKPGVAFIVLHARVPVIPAFIWGTPATDLVVTGLLTRSHAHVIYGAPIDPSVFETSGPIDHERLASVAEQLMDAIRALQTRALGATPTEEVYEPTRLGRRTEEGAGSLSGDRPALRGA